MVKAQDLIDRFVAHSGGDLVSTSISKAPDFDNADYLFRLPDLPPVVAELKCLEEDRANLDKKKLEDLYEKWVRKGLVPDFRGREVIQAAHLPLECQKELFKVLGQRIKKDRPPSQ